MSAHDVFLVQSPADHESRYPALFDLTVLPSTCRSCSGLDQEGAWRWCGNYRGRPRRVYGLGGR